MTPSLVLGRDSNNVLTPLLVDASGRALVVLDPSGLPVPVTVATALPAGTNNIGDVDIASALPAGTNLIGQVDARGGDKIFSYNSVLRGSFATGALGAGTVIAGPIFTVPGGSVYCVTSWFININSAAITRFRIIQGTGIPWGMSNPTLNTDLSERGLWVFSAGMAPSVQFTGSAAGNSATIAYDGYIMRA